jgi:DNA-binding HxlR family transcriptional regulator
VVAHRYQLEGGRRVEDRPIPRYYSLTAKGEALGPVFERLDDGAAEWVEGR